jgi:hypothetical protein
MDLARFYRERLCPCCGYSLNFTPWENGVGNEKPCPCCGIHFGWDDLDEARREEVYFNWRKRWIVNRKRWWSSKPMPPNYNPDEQLKRLERLVWGRPSKGRG